MARLFKQVVTSDTGIGIGKVVDTNTAYPVITYLERWYHPAVAHDDSVLLATAIGSVATTLSPASLVTATMDFPRNLQVICTVASTGHIHVTGTNYDGATVTEQFACATDAVVGNVAFATITSVLIDARSGSASDVVIGYGSKLGLKRQIVDLDVIGSVDGVFEANRPTVSTAYNTVTFDTALSASKTYILKYDSSDYDG